MEASPPAPIPTLWCGSWQIRAPATAACNATVTISLAQHGPPSVLCVRHCIRFRLGNVFQTFKISLQSAWPKSWRVFLGMKEAGVTGGLSSRNYGSPPDLLDSPQVVSWRLSHLPGSQECSEDNMKADVARIWSSSRPVTHQDDWASRADNTVLGGLHEAKKKPQGLDSSRTFPRTSLEMSTPSAHTGPHRWSSWHCPGVGEEGRGVGCGGKLLWSR